MCPLKKPHSHSPCFEKRTHLFVNMQFFLSTLVKSSTMTLVKSCTNDSEMLSKITFVKHLILRKILGV